MALLINDTDFRDQIPVNLNFEIKRVNPDIRRVQNRLLKWILGTTLFNSLLAAYDGGTPTTAQTDLLEYVHPVLANVAFALSLSKIQVIVDDNGLHIISNENEKTAFSWQVREMRNSHLNTGFDCVEDLIQFLEDNLATYTTWDSVNSREFFINDAITFNEYVGISERRMLLMLIKPSMRRIEKVSIEPETGSALFAEMKSQILANGEVQANNTQIIGFIQAAVAHLSYADALIKNVVKLDDTGVNMYSNRLMGSDEQFEPSSAEELMPLRMEHMKQGQEYIEKLRRYLHENAALFPLYQASDAYSEELVYDQPDPQDDSGFFPTMI